MNNNELSIVSYRSFMFSGIHVPYLGKSSEIYKLPTGIYKLPTVQLNWNNRLADKDRLLCCEYLTSHRSILQKE